MKKMTLVNKVIAAVALALAIIVAVGTYEFGSSSSDGTAFNKPLVMTASPLALTVSAKQYYDTHPGAVVNTPHALSIEPTAGLAMKFFALAIAAFLVIHLLGEIAARKGSSQGPDALPA